MSTLTPTAEVLPRPSGRRACGHRPGRRGLRLTTRGRILVALLAVLVMSAVFTGLSLRSAEASGAPSGWVAIQVQPGDTLWGFARQLDPGADPRGVIAEIRAANGLNGAELKAGQRLWVPPVRH